MIRSFRESDSKEIETLYEKSNSAVSLNVPSGFFKKDKKKFTSSTIRQCKNLVFEDKNRIVGIISYSCDYIEGLFVAPEFWNTGIGSELLNRALGERKELHLQVYSDNARAVEFYRKRGFEVSGKGVCQMTGLPYFEMTRCEKGTVKP